MDFRKTLINKRKYIIIGALSVSVVTIILGLGLGLGLQLQQCKNKLPETCRNSCCYDFMDICLQPIESWECTPLRCGEKHISDSKCHCSSDYLGAGDCCTNYGIVCNGMTPWVQDQCVKMSGPKCPSSFKRQPLLLISLDGLRAEYQHTWHSLIPVLDKLRECGTSSAFMQPVFPSKTFPNHYSIVTINSL
ncbi:venom phosphodiesterase-like [Tachysurus fulvidraco]|uniref:venom phosphodiesterase-like n=1 Tax=Tachysurus fulvidraco TaxID=1234273 RepID=UPI001FF02BCA|nr:venom phosphodiesterase-like [Tachysurus fulvidraco]